jgi:hypothetical protein
MYFEVTLYFCLNAPDHQTYFHHFIVNTEVIISACLYTIFQIHIHLKLSNYFNQIYGVVVGVIASSVVDRGFKPSSGQIKDYKIDISVSSKDWLTRNRDNVSEWSNLSTH